tara:strand:+ start:42372 stop:42488 length:117 start_codon:yes stop_codon:yes gene_type:complete
MKRHQETNKMRLDEYKLTKPSNINLYRVKVLSPLRIHI